MDSDTLEELSQHFMDKLSHLNGILAIEESICDTGCDTEFREDCLRGLEAAWREMDDLSIVLTLMRNHIDEQKKALVRAEVCRFNSPFILYTVLLETHIDNFTFSVNDLDWVVFVLLHK